VDDLILLSSSHLVDLPMELAELHAHLQVGDTHQLQTSLPDLQGRLTTVVEAAGFRVQRITPQSAPPASAPLRTVFVRVERALPDHVGENMAMLCCGLNPSLHAADAGVGYVTGSNRFWRAMDAAGLAGRDRDPHLLLREHHIGMTDLVKRATARADELTTAEYRTGVARLDELCEWLQPATVAAVGLAGWRAAVDRKATAGWQPRPLGGRPVYLLPSTSGLNAGTSLDDLVAHLQQAHAGPPAS